MLKNRLGLVVGVVLGVVGTSFVQRDGSTVEAQKAKPVAPTSTTDGRYQIIFSPSGIRADTFLLDTQTGRMWAPTEFTDLEGHPTVWQYQDRVDNQQQLMTWAAGFRAKGK